MAGCGENSEVPPGTVSLGLHFQAASLQQPFPLHAYCDAYWASDPDDRRSTSGAVTLIGPNLISWWSKKKSVVACSSTKSEYRSMALIAAEVTWIQSLLSELQVPHTTPVILCDNTSTVSLAHNPVLHSRTKHMELDLFFVREKVLTKQINVVCVPALDQLADILTKAFVSCYFSFAQFQAQSD